MTRTVLDIHAHALPLGLLRSLDGRQSDLGVGVTNADGRYHLTTPFNQVFVDPRYYAVPERLAELDRMGIDRQVLMPSATLLPYWMPPGDATWFCRAYNDSVAAMADEAAARLVPAANVPLQDPDGAVAELRYAVDELGMRIVEVASNVDGRSLGRPELDPFWSAAADLGVLVFVHPAGRVVSQPRPDTFHLRNVVGLPSETAFVFVDLVGTGVLDRHPRLRICLAHGGGTMPYLLSRMERAQRSRAEWKSVERPVREYARRVFVDTVVHDPDALRFAVSQLGAERMLFGTDLPADMNAVGGPDMIADVFGDDIEASAGVLGKNALGVLSRETNEEEGGSPR